MKIQTRKIAERTLEYTDNITGKKEKMKMDLQKNQKSHYKI